MSSAERAREYRAAKKRGDYVPPAQARWLPWPREADDGTPLGVDLSSAADDVRRIMLKHFRPPAGVEFDDYYQEVCAKIASRNHMPSAHDPRKSSLGHYVYMVANATGANMANSESRRPSELSLQGAAGAVGPDGPVLEDVIPSCQDLSLPDAELALNSLVVQGAIGPTARSYALDCLAGRSLSRYGTACARTELLSEIAVALRT